MPAKGTIPRVCQQCGEPFLARSGNVERGYGRFCSRSCTAQFHFRHGLSVEEFFWSHVRKTASCWLWTGGVSGNGYGAFRVNGKQVGAHRFAYELINGPMAEGTFACHRCDNPLCVNPAHLFAGDAKANHQDMMDKDRHPHGEGHPKAKLTDGDVIAIRSAFTGKVGEMAALARHYGVNQSTIARIVHNERWTHASVT